MIIVIAFKIIVAHIIFKRIATLRFCGPQWFQILLGCNSRVVRTRVDLAACIARVKLKGKGNDAGQSWKKLLYRRERSIEERLPKILKSEPLVEASTRKPTKLFHTSAFYSFDIESDPGGRESCAMTGVGSTTELKTKQVYNKHTGLVSDRPEPDHRLWFGQPQTVRMILAWSEALIEIEIRVTASCSTTLDANM